MNKKQLVELGLTEEIADQIVVLHGKDIESHKAKLTTLQAESDGYKNQLTEANTAIEGFKALKIEDIQKAADDWKAKAETATTESAKQFAALKFDHALESALTGAKAKNPKAVQALLSKDLLKLNDADGSIVGLNEQLEKIKLENDYLFEDTTPAPKIVTGANNQSVLSDKIVDAARQGAGLVVAK